jgi:hypothetical protein
MAAREQKGQGAARLFHPGAVSDMAFAEKPEKA